MEKSIKTGNTVAIDKNTLTRIFNLLKDHTRLDFTHYKPTTINCCIERRMMVSRINSSLDPSGCLLPGISETIGETYDCFELLHLRHRVYRSLGKSGLTGRTPAEQTQNEIGARTYEKLGVEGKADREVKKRQRIIYLVKELQFARESLQAVIGGTWYLMRASPHRIGPAAYSGVY